jgi:hypothetical protein
LISWRGEQLQAQDVTEAPLLLLPPMKMLTRTKQELHGQLEPKSGCSTR